MEIKKLMPYMLKGAAAGIAAALILFLFVDTGERTGTRPVVEIKEVTSPPAITSTGDARGF